MFCESSHWVHFLPAYPLDSKDFQENPIENRMDQFPKICSEDPEAYSGCLLGPQNFWCFFASSYRRRNPPPKFEDLRMERCNRGIRSLYPPLPLSRRTTCIDIEFAEGTPTVMVASMITKLSTLYPDLEYIALSRLSRDPVIAEAASEMLLAYNRDTMRRFEMDSPLTEEEREAID